MTEASTAPSLPVDEWARHLGREWVGLLAEHALDSGSRVVELGPGFSAKIAYGLGAVAFRGELVLVEPNLEARRYAEAVNGTALPEARVRAVASLGDDLGAVDFLVANHLLDDLVLAACVGSAHSDRLFTEMVPGQGCTAEFVAVWRALLDGSGDDLRRLVARVVDTMADAVRQVRPRCLIVNEYPSGRHRESGLAGVHDIALCTLAALEHALRADPTWTSILRRCADIHWLVCDRRVAA